MSWIKRNLYFVIGSVVALALMGLAGYFLYSKWALNNTNLEALNSDYEKLRRLNTQNPHPGSGETDNIKIAKAQREELIALSKKSRDYFQPIVPIPEGGTNLTDQDFSAALARTIDRMQKDATNASLTLPPDYNFSFQAQKQRVSFAANSLSPLAIQLGEVKTIADILFQAKINSLDNVRRERVSADDSNGPVTDYLSEKSVTNELAVLTPYEVTFRCFSTELAAVLSGFAASPHGLVVKTTNVEPAPATQTTEPGAPVVYTPVTPVYPQATPSGGMDQNAFMRRYGIGPGSRYGGGRRGGEGGGAGMGGIAYRGLEQQAPPPQPAYAPATPGQPGAPGAPKGSLPVVLDEKLLKVTMNVIVVKLLPPK